MQYNSLKDTKTLYGNRDYIDNNFGKNLETKKTLESLLSRVVAFGVILSTAIAIFNCFSSYKKIVK